MSQEIKLDRETKDKIKQELEKYEETMGVSVEKLFNVAEKTSPIMESLEVPDFNTNFLDSHSKKVKMISQVTELKEVMDQDMEMIMEVDEELGRTLFKIGEIVTGVDHE